MSDNPTLDPTGGTGALVAATTDDETKKLEIVQALQGYWNEADNNRKGGLNPRDAKWQQNLDLYWGRRDYSKKATWQNRSIMPEVPSYVDRFAAALKESMIASPGGFYTVSDPADRDGDLAQAVKKMTDMWLSRTGRNMMGTVLPFSAVFEEQMKLGAIMATNAAVVWKGDVKGGRVAIETIDPRFTWFDHTFRNLYRIRRIELDRHELMTMAKEKDSKGSPIYDVSEMARLVGHVNAEDQQNRERLSGHGENVSTGRSPVTIDEYIATVVNSQGEKIADRALLVLANKQFLIRGPEKNPFWHGNDWTVYAPLVTAPLSVYGRSYMEDFGSVADTFIELTNMLLDAVYTSSLKAFAVVPGMLLNPEQVAAGITPNKTFMLDDGYKPEDFMKAIDLGTLQPDSLKMWEAMKNELTDAAYLNEIGLGQFAPKGRTSATEVNQTQQSSSALIRSVAQTVESRFLDPVLDLVWKTGLQHVGVNDANMAAAVGEDMFKALISKRRELIQRPLTFQARGISELIQRASTLKSLLGLMQVLSQDQILLQQFLKIVDLEKLTRKLFELSGIDLTSLQLSQREKMMKGVIDQFNQAGAGAEGSAQGTSPGQNAADMAQGQAGVAGQMAEMQQKLQHGDQSQQQALQQSDQMHQQRLAHTDQKHQLGMARTAATPIVAPGGGSGQAQ